MCLGTIDKNEVRKKIVNTKTCLEQLIKDLHSDDIKKQIHSVMKLAKSHKKEAINPLLKLLGECHSDYRRRILTCAIIEALGKLKAKQAEPLLRQMLDNNTFYYITASTAEALGDMHPSRKTVQELEYMLAQDNPKQVKESVIKGLGKMKNEESVQPLIGIMQQDTDEDLRKAAIDALGNKHKTQATPALIDTYYKKDSLNVKKSIIQALSKIADGDSIEFLIQALTNKNKEIRECAALALGETCDKRAEMHLKRLLNDPAIEVRKSAAKGLGLIVFLKNGDRNGL